MSSVYCGGGKFSPTVWAHALPFPPSINNYHRAIMRGRYPRQIISRDGRAFQNACYALLRKAPRLVGCRYAVELELTAPDRRKRDLDNRVKPVLDALVKAKIVEDDSLFDCVTITRGEIARPGGVTVRIASLTEVSE